MFPMETDINNKTIFEQRQIPTVLSTLPDGSAPSSMRTHISQSIKNPPPPPSEIMMFPVLIS